MGYKDIKNAVKIDKDFSNQDKNIIFGVIKEAYAKSSIARDMFDHWVDDLGKKITFNYKEGSFAAYLSTGKSIIDMNQLDHASYIDKNGNAVRDFPFTAIIHELGHALTGRIDNPTATNPAGENQLFVNKIYVQAGYAEQLAYLAYDASGDVIQRGTNYTDGARIDNAWVKKYDDMPNNHDTTRNGNFTEPYRDLVIGSADVNVLKTGKGADFLYGLAGDDELSGGSSGDRLNGGDGADTLDGGGGLDYASYKLATSGVIADLSDTTRNTASAFGDIFLSIEGLIGSGFGDELTGNGEKNTIEGGKGADTLVGLAGDDELDGGNGTDRAVYLYDFDEYQFNKNKGTISSELEGKDHLTKVEFAVFANGVLDLQTGEFTGTFGRTDADYLV